MFDYYVGSGLKGLIYMYLHVCFHVCSVLFCFVVLCMYVLFVYCMHIYVCSCVYVYLYVYIYVHTSVHIYTCVYVCAGTHCYLYKRYLLLSCRHLGCYLGSILAFSVEFQNLNTTICTKTSNKST